MYWIPLIATLAYIGLTLALFAAGPIVFHIASPFEFYSYMFLYMAALAFGYVVGKAASKNIVTRSTSSVNNVLSKRGLFLVFVVGALCSSSITLHLDSFFTMLDPKFILGAVINGLSDPGSLYAAKMEKFRSTQSNKSLSAIIFLIAPFKVLFISVFIAFWSRINSLKKIIGILIVFIVYLLPALLTGTNKPIFDLLIYSSTSLFTVMLIDIKNGKRNALRRMRIAIGISLALCLVAFSFFALTTSARSGKSTYIETTSPLHEIQVRPEFRDGGSKLKEFYVWFTSYVVQGYYGFSLAMQEKFTSTYGFGSSVFLARQVKDILGIDLSSRTYQRKITAKWDESAQWHSFFSYIANDVHFIGVIFVCFFLGVFFAMIWHTCLRESNFWSFLMLPLMALLVIFMPANNQVFGLPESFSSFYFVLFGWLSSIKIVQSQHADSAISYLPYSKDDSMNR